MTNNNVDLEANLVAINDSLSQALGGLESISRKEGCNYTQLSESDYNSLYERARVFQNMVNLIPEDSNLVYPDIKSWDSTEDVSKLQLKLENIPAIGEALEPIDLKGAVTLAGIYSRLYGDGFIFLGIRDGKETHEPVDWNNVKGVDWVVVRNKYEVGLNFWDNTITAYSSGVNVKSEMDGGRRLSGQTFHITRVFRFVGVSRHGSHLSKDGFNMSVIDGVYADYLRYLNAIKAGADMLASHSTFKFGMVGLHAKSLKESVTVALRKRFQNILDGIKILGGVLYDSEKESAEYINRSYAGVKDILEHLQDWLVGNSGMTRGKVFGSAAKAAMSSNAEGEEKQWGEIIDRYRATQVLPFYNYILKLMLASDKSDADEYYLEFGRFYQESPKQQAEIEKLKADTLKTKTEAIEKLQSLGFYSDTELKEMFEN